MDTPEYSTEPEDPREFTRRFDSFYSRFAPIYSLLLTAFPVWHRWTHHALPYLAGPRVLEVSFGTGHLMAEYAGKWGTFGIDLNVRMAMQAGSRLARAGLFAHLQVANVEYIPYAGSTFDTVVNTMALSGYPNGKRALREMRRVLKPMGKLVMVDVNFPQDGNTFGTILTKFWRATGDLIRDVPNLFRAIGWSCQDLEVGGYGSVHLYLAEK